MKTITLNMFFFFLFCLSAFSQEAKKIDEFGDLYCDDYLARMDYPINEVKKNPSSTVYVFVYEGKERKDGKLAFPAFGSARARISSIKKLIIQLPPTRKVSLERFKFIEAGFRENFTIELWMAPVGAAPPKPTPTLTKMKYRKGKPHGFCLGCCGS